MKVPKRVYIAGPITGVKDWEAPFNAMADRLRQAGLVPVSPVELSEFVDKQEACGKHEAPVEAYLRHDFRILIDACDAIVLLPGWTESKGARLEFQIAVATGKEILGDDFEPLSPMPDVHLEIFDMRESIAHQAHRLVTGNRRKSYSPPEENFEEIATGWAWWLKGRNPTVTDVGPMMMIFKMARLKASYKEDTVRDIIGYGETTAIVARKK